MHPLKTRFEELFEATIDSGGNINLGGLLYGPVELIKNLGEGIYNNAFSIWRSETWLPEKTDQINDWFHSFNCSERFQSLCDALSLNNVIPYVGAGMSVPSGFRQWREVLDRLKACSLLAQARYDELMAIHDYGV
jgi:hypothetical protein